jgi:DegV family protein with EDD domain
MIRIVTDSTAGLPAELAAQHGIAVVPQVIIFGEEQFLEMEELSGDAFMTRLQTTRILPKTAAPSPGAFETVYRPWAEAGDTILSLHPSADISGTVRGATAAAAAFPGTDIRILDTRTIAGPLGRLTLLAAEMAAEGRAADEIWGRLNALAPRARIYFLVDTLEYLQRGGRIGGAAALVGSVLQIKPILGLHEGKVVVIERQRTHSRALSRLKELVIAAAARGEAAYLAVMDAGRPLLAQTLADELQTALDAPDVFSADLVPAIVTHTGPGALGVGFFVPETA